MLKRTSATATIGTITMIMKNSSNRLRKLTGPSSLFHHSGVALAWTGLGVGHPSRAALEWAFHRIRSRPWRSCQRFDLPLPSPARSRPLTAFAHGAIAQLEERLDRTQEVAGSSPASSI